MALTNEFTQRGYQGRGITVRLYDPKFGPSSNWIHNADVSVSLARSSDFGLVDVFAPLAHMGSTLYQGSGQHRVSAQFYNFPHTQMDNMMPFGAVPAYVPGRQP